jgi:ABC-2 type transport system ATP-binding protein
MNRASSHEGTLQNAVEINDITKIFPGMDRPALNKISVSLRKVILTGFFGRYGAVKTTLIRLMAGLLRPTNGTIEVMGCDTLKNPDRLHEITGYMPQKFGLYEDLTVLENLNLYAELHELDEKDKKSAFSRMLKFTSLAPFTDRLAGNLSGGMKQKLGLACSLLGRPQVLLLDEPSVGVDPLSRRELWKMVLDLVGQGISVVWSTSYLEEADKCQEVLLLNEGNLLFYGPPKKLAQRVEGRVFQVTVPLKTRRVALKNFLNRNDIEDGVIQGSKLHLVGAPSFQLEDKDSEWQSVKPKVEDAFIDLLGGHPGGRSALAEKMLTKEVQTTPPIQAEHLTKKFGNFTAANDISFTIKQGEVFGLLGPNGAGKSTIFKMLCGLLQPTMGKALVSGLDLKKAASEARMKIGYMAQKFSLYGDLSVQENLNFFSGVYGLVGQERRKKMDQMIQIFEFSPYLDSNAGLLPLGYKQRLALACAVMHEPDVLFLDEPTSGVDPLTRREFWAHINGMVEKKVTIMVTTHFMEEAEYCDRISLIYQGVSIAMGTPDYIKTSAKTKDNPNPTLEDAFITLIERIDSQKEKGER